MKSLLVLLSVLCWIVPLASSQNCRELLADGWQPDQPIDFPDGFSLRDIFTAKAETIGGKGKQYFLHLMRGAQYVARTSLSPRGKFMVLRPDDAKVQAFSMSDLVDTRTGSLLLQMKCDERSTTCKVTSQTNTALEVFNYQPAVPRFLSTNRIEVSNFVLEIFSLRSISLCKPREPSVITEVTPSGPVREGESYSLICRVRGLPVLAASWSKDEVELEEATAQLDQEESTEEQTLTLTYIVAELSSEDLGRYVCKGRSLLVSEEGASSDVSLIMSREEEEEETEVPVIVTTTESVGLATDKTEDLDNENREPSTTGSEENESESDGSEGTESNSGDSGSGESEGNEDGSAEDEAGDGASDADESQDTESQGNDHEENNDDNEGDNDGNESSNSSGSTNSSDESSDTSQPKNELCKFIGQNITRRKTMNFPESFNLSDVVTVKGQFTGKIGYMFYLSDNTDGKDWMFYRYKDGTTLSTFHPHGQLQLFNNSSHTTLKIQIFHKQSAESLNIITPYAAEAFTGFERTKLDINSIKVNAPLNSHYDYISICRRQDPEITLTVTPHNYTLGDTVTLLCTLSGPPFLSGYWTRKGVVISSQDTLDETKAEQTLELKLVLSNIYTGDLGEYRCYGRGSLMAPNTTLERGVDLTYQKPITITKPASDTYNILPVSFTWLVEGYPFKNLGMKCTDVDVKRSTPVYKMPATPPYQFDVTLEENLEKFNCTLYDGKDILEIYQFSKCGNGSHILEGRCVPCPAGQNSSVLTNYTCIRDEDNESEDGTEEGGNKEGEEKEEEEKEEEDQGGEVDEPNDEEQEDEGNDESLDEKDGASNKNSLPAIIGSCVGVAVLIMITVIVILVLMKKRKTKEKELRRRASESQVRNRTISAPILHYHISGEVSEVTISTNIRMRSSSLERSAAIPDTEAASSSNAEPVYATVSKPVKPKPDQSEENKEDLYSNLDREPRRPSELRHKEPIYNDAELASTDDEFADIDAEPVYNNIDPAYNDIDPAYNDIESAYNDGEPMYAKVNKPVTYQEQEEEEEEESAYADLEYMGKVRTATGSIVKKEESVDPTYATITEFQKAEETEEQFDFTDV